MPKSDPKCEDNNLSKYIFGHCYDKIYSGHTAFTLMAIIIAYKFKFVI